MKTTIEVPAIDVADLEFEGLVITDAEPDVGLSAFAEWDAVYWNNIEIEIPDHEMGDVVSYIVRNPDSVGTRRALRKAA